MGAAHCLTKLHFKPLKEWELRANSSFSDKICLLLVYHSRTLSTSANASRGGNGKQKKENT